MFAYTSFIYLYMCVLCVCLRSIVYPNHENYCVELKKSIGRIFRGDKRILRLLGINHETERIDDGACVFECMYVCVMSVRLFYAKYDVDALLVVFDFISVRIFSSFKHIISFRGVCSFLMRFLWCSVLH